MSWAFAIPGDPATPTGGYIYDARVIDASAGGLTALRLPDGFPRPTPPALAATRDALMATGPCLIDGLAYGTLPSDMLTALPHKPIALCHHPLGLETGLSKANKDRMIATERANLALARHVIVTSDATKRTLLEMFGLEDSAVTVAPPGLDEAPVARGSGGTPVLFTVGSLTRRKGHDVLVDALARLADLDWRAVWVGPVDRDPDWAAGIHAQIQTAGLGSRIEIRGAVDAPTLNDAYHSADIFVLPSRYEGYGMVFDEAMMRGLPVVACTTGAVPDVVPPEAGVLAPPDDPAALAEFIETLLNDLPRRAAMGTHARKHATTLPGWADTWSTIRNVLETHS